MWLQIMFIFMATSTIAQKCSLDSPIALCSNEGWTKIPTGQQESVEILNLSENNIQKIVEGDLDRFERLENLYIDNCKLETVGRSAFKHLRQLSYVDLSHNRLTYIDNDMFRSNTRLTELVLSDNQLQIHKWSPVLVSTSIQSLKMRNCGIREISSAMFSKLEKLRQLDLSENNILTISDRAFDCKHLENVCVDPEVFSVPAFSRIRSKAVTVKFTTYNAAAGNVSGISNVQMTPDVKKETSTVSSTSDITFKSYYPLSVIQPVNGESSETNTAHTSSVTPKYISIMSVRDQRKTEPENSVQIVRTQISNSTTSEGVKKEDVAEISHEKDTDQSEPAYHTFGASIGKGEMYAMMAVSMSVGAAICYALILLCRKRRSNVPNRVSEPTPVFVGTSPDSTSWMHPVVYKMVPQYELEYPNDMYELPRAPTRHDFVPPVHLPWPTISPPLPPRPPRMSVSSHHEYEYIQSAQGEVPTSR